MNRSITKVATYISWIIAGILVLLPFHALFTTWLGSNTGHLDLIRIWKELIIILITPAAIWLAWKQPKLKEWLINSWIVRLYGLYVLLHLILGTIAVYYHLVNKSALVYSLVINLRFIGFFIICYIAAASVIFLKKNWRNILLIPAGIVVVFGIIQRFLMPYDFLRHFGYGPNTIPAFQTIDNNIDYRRIQSTLRGANPLGAYLVFIISAIIVSFNNRAAKFIYLFFAFAAIFLSYSRSAWVGLLLAIATLILISKLYVGRLRWIFLALGVAVILGIVGFLNLRSNQAAQNALYHTSSESTSIQSTNAARSNALKNGLNDVIIEPLGRGPGTAGPASYRNGSKPRIAENYYIQISQEIGVFGLVIFLAINVMVVLGLWKNRSDKLSQILLASFVGIFFINLLSHEWTDDTLSLLWWGFAGIALAPDILKTRRKQNGKKQKKKS